jgi:hypothetical protein
MKYFLLLSFLVVAISPFAQAQTDQNPSATPRKFFVNYGPSGSFIKTKSNKGSFGGGSVLTIGWYFNDRFGVYLMSQGYHMEKARFNSVDPETYFRWGLNGIGVRYTLMSQSRTHLYLDGAWLQSSIKPDVPEKIIFSGNGLRSGIGVNHFIPPQWSVSADLVYVYSNFRRRVERDRTIDFDMSGHGATISAGFAWHPYANRKAK